jgi:hypothetical protein
MHSLRMAPDVPHRFARRVRRTRIRVHRVVNCFARARINHAALAVPAVKHLEQREKPREAQRVHVRSRIELLREQNRFVHQCARHFIRLQIAERIPFLLRRHQFGFIHLQLRVKKECVEPLLFVSARARQHALVHRAKRAAFGNANLYLGRRKRARDCSSQDRRNFRGVVDDLLHQPDFLVGAAPCRQICHCQ